MNLACKNVGRLCTSLQNHAKLLPTALSQSTLTKTTNCDITCSSINRKTYFTRCFETQSFANCSKLKKIQPRIDRNSVISNYQSDFQRIKLFKPSIQQCCNLSTSAKLMSQDKGSEMTAEERLLYKAIKSESDCSPVEEKLVIVNESSDLSEPDLTKGMILKKGKKKKTEKFKEKMVENLNFPNVTVYGVGRLNLESLQEEFENDELYIVCQLPPEFKKEVLMVRSKNKKQDGTYTDAFFFRSYGVACWAMNQHQGEELVLKAMNSSRNRRGMKGEDLFTSLQDAIDNREVFRTVQSESIKRVKDKIHIPSLTDDSLSDEKKSLNLALNKYTFSKSLLQSVILGLFEERLDDFIENRGLLQRTQELKLGVDSSMNSKNVYTSFGEISYIRYQTNLSDLFTEDPDEYWEYDDLSNLYTDMVTYLSLPKRLRELNRNLDYCQDLIKLFNERLTDKHHVNLEKIIIGLIFIEVVIEVIRILFPYIKTPLSNLLHPTQGDVNTEQAKAS